MNSTAEMIFTGDELLRGDAVNTNQAFLGRRLLDLGILPMRSICVRDDREQIVSAIRDGLQRKPLIIVLSGGLGPTDDDLTREATAEALGRPLEHHEDLHAEIRRHFARRGYVMTGNNRKQALLPRGASPIPNVGTAPGFSIEENDTIIVALPGVPWEMAEMWIHTVEPLLRTRLAVGGRPRHIVRHVRTFGIGESMMADMLGDIEWRGGLLEIGTRADPGCLSIVLQAIDSPAGLQQLEEVQDRVCSLLGEKVLGIDCPGLSEIVGGLLKKACYTVCTAESCTGGLVATYLTDVPGSSAYFTGGVVTYDNEMKTQLLGVDERTLAAHGAVSPQVAREMAIGAGRALNTDCAVSTTGIAGPDGGTESKPVGLVYIASVVRRVPEVEELRLFGRRAQVRERAALSVLDHLRRRLLQPIRPS
jgi:nicotinamide-nucleotide amidase